MSRASLGIRHKTTSAFGGFLLLSLLVLNARAEDQLPAWRETMSKRTIREFVERVTRDGSAEFLPASERVAIFAHDGTLQSEQPVPAQVAYLYARLEQVRRKPSAWRTQEPFASLLRGDFDALYAQGAGALDRLMISTHAGQTSGDFERSVLEWFVNARHPLTGEGYSAMTYQPMLEMLAYLRANGFSVYLLAGGNAEFLRVWAPRIYGVPRENILGTVGPAPGESRQRTRAARSSIATGEDEITALQAQLGRRPLIAFASSDREVRLLEWVAAGQGPRLSVLLHHNDSVREWAYDRRACFGRLDRGLSLVKNSHWTLVSMRDDWEMVHPPSRDGSVEPRGGIEVALAVPWGP